jgi:hypothetical protein
MNLRLTLFAVWCGFAAPWWLVPIFDGTVDLILLKLHIGGWRGAFVHTALTALIAVGVPMAILVFGRIVLWRVDRINYVRLNPN